LPITHLDIADYLGLTMETISRTFTRLHTEGLIDMVSHGHMVIRDSIALEGLAGGMA
jgi:CRP/FNR family transcriptional regulator